MNHDLVIPTHVAAPTPGQLTAYLLASGWTAAASTPRWAEFHRPDGLTLEIPLLGHAPDYPRAVRRVLDYLSEVGARDLAAIHRAILTHPPTP